MTVGPLRRIETLLRPEEFEKLRQARKAKDQCPGCGAHSWETPHPDCTEPEGCGYVRRTA